jgi:hypothetical protein
MNSPDDARTAQLLRISCSDIAAVTGFHPWAKLDETFEKYLYQDLDELMVQDAENLDTEFLTTEQEVQKILHKIDAKEKAALSELDTATKDDTVLNSNTKAEQMLKQIQELMKSSGVLSKISSTELKFVENEFRGRVRKNYGINCENKSLDRYEEIMGFSVGDRNLETIRMKVPPLSRNGTTVSRTSSSSSTKADEDVGASEDAFSVLLNGSRRLSKEQALAAQNGGAKRRRKEIKPSFLLVGRVDGISHQLDLRNDDPTQWSTALRVVVEMKSRVRGISSPPPLYEQIQLVSYMIMLECDCGDLVQAVARAPMKVTQESAGTLITTGPADVMVVAAGSGGDDERKGDEACGVPIISSAATVETHSTAELCAGVAVNRTTTTCTTASGAGATEFVSTSTITATATLVSSSTRQQSRYHAKPRKPDPTALHSEEDFQVNRIMLDGPPFYHRKYWDTVVMPRLRMFRDAVYAMRCDDALRYAYLMSSPEAKLQMLQNLCPYIDI